MFENIQHFTQCLQNRLGQHNNKTVRENLQELVDTLYNMDESQNPPSRYLSAIQLKLRALIRENFHSAVSNATRKANIEAVRVICLLLAQDDYPLSKSSRYSNLIEHGIFLGVFDQNPV